jgi:catechol 2,3-dioxygenase-like lactoylglutathione lyase family enzyme
VPDDVPASQPLAVLDHVAIGASTLGDGWELFGGLLGGAWAYGGDSPGFWWGQLQYSAGPKVELLTPKGGADAAFLERFLADRGPGFHHLNFIVPAIEVTLGKIRALGIEPTQVRLQNPQWKEAFLHPGDAYGTVIQVAQQERPPPPSSPPAGLGKPARSCALSLIEQLVADIDGAVRLFRDVLDGELVNRWDTADGPVAELSWPNAARLRLVQSAADGRASLRTGQGIAQLRFTRDDGAFGPADLEKAAALSRRLGVSLQLGEVD